MSVSFLGSTSSKKVIFYISRQYDFIASPLFEDGKWESIEIRVLDEKYLDCAKKLADNYF